MKKKCSPESFITMATDPFWGWRQLSNRWLGKNSAKFLFPRNLDTSAFRRICFLLFYFFWIINSSLEDFLFTCHRQFWICAVRFAINSSSARFLQIVKAMRANYETTPNPISEFLCISSNNTSHAETQNSFCVGLKRCPLVDNLIIKLEIDKNVHFAFMSYFSFYDISFTTTQYILKRVLGIKK